jgi:hypothetical protein
MARSITYDDIDYISSQIKDDSLWRSIFSYYFSYNLSAFRIPLVKNMCSKSFIDLIEINSGSYEVLKTKIITSLFSDVKFKTKLKHYLIAPYDKKHQTEFARLIFETNKGKISDVIFQFPQNLLDKFIIDYCVTNKLYLLTYNGNDILSNINDEIIDGLAYYNFHSSQMLSDQTRVKFVGHLTFFYRQLFIDNIANILELTLYKYDQNIATKFDYDVDKVIKSLLNVKTSWGTPQLSELSDVTKELFNAMNIVFSQSVENDIVVI